MANDQQFPTSVYKCPGRYPGNSGRSYSLQPAADQAELDALLGDGWSMSLPAAEYAFDLTKTQVASSQPSTTTPEERAAAAEAQQSAAADRLTQANEALIQDQALSDSADKALLDATSKYEAAEAEYQKQGDLKSAALANSQAASKSLASSKLRQAAADKALDDATARLLTMGDLAIQAKQKSLDAATAKQKAIAAAKAKEAAPTTAAPLEAAPEPVAAPTAAPPTPTAPAPGTATPTTKAKGK